MRLFKKKVKKEEIVRNDELLKAVKKFISFYENEVKNKSDCQIEWMDFSKECYKMFYDIAREYPEIKKIVKWKPNESPEDYRYVWIDIFEGRYKQTYNEMKIYKDSFFNNNVWEKYINCFEKNKDEFRGNELTIENIGPYGGGIMWPYNYCAYLSMAYYEKTWYKKIIKKLNEWIENSK